MLGNLVKELGEKRAEYARRSGLFLQANAGRFLARPKMMASGAVGADHHAASKLAAQLPAPHFKRAGGDEFEVVKMGVDTQRFHDGQV